MSTSAVSVSESAARTDNKYSVASRTPSGSVAGSITSEHAAAASVRSERSEKSERSERSIRMSERSRRTDKISVLQSDHNAVSPTPSYHGSGSNATCSVKTATAHNTPLSHPLSSIASLIQRASTASTRPGVPHSSSVAPVPAPAPANSVEGHIILAAFQQLQDRITELHAECEKKTSEVQELKAAHAEAAKQDQTQSLSVSLSATVEQQAGMLEAKDTTISELRAQLDRGECKNCIGSAEVIAQLTSEVVADGNENVRLHKELSEAREALLAGGEKYRKVGQKLETAEKSLEAIYQACASHNFPIPIPGYTPTSSPSPQRASLQRVSPHRVPQQPVTAVPPLPYNEDDPYESTPRRTYRLGR